MGNDAHLDDRELLRLHRAALHSFASEISEIIQGSLATLQRASAEVDEAVRNWQEQRAQAQRDLAAAISALRACHADPEASCGAEAEAVDEAKAWLAECESNLSRAHTCRRQMHELEQRFRREATRFGAVLGQDVPRAAALLGRLASAADSYAGMAAPSGGLAGGGAFTGGGAGGGTSMGGGAGMPTGGGGKKSPAADTIGNTDLVEVRLGRIDTGDSTVGGPETFRKVDRTTMRTGIQRLDEVVLPAVRGGADSAHFARMDARLGLDYEHGYQRVFDAFFGQDSLRLDGRADGSFGVTNGQHRIHLARELGLPTLPARVDWPGGER